MDVIYSPPLIPLGPGNYYQFRLKLGTGGNPWMTPSDDWSLQGNILNGSFKPTNYIAIYQYGTLVYGIEPSCSFSTTTFTNTYTPTNTKTFTNASTNTLTYIPTNTPPPTNTFTMTFSITNTRTASNTPTATFTCSYKPPVSVSAYLEQCDLYRTQIQIKVTNNDSISLGPVKVRYYFYMDETESFTGWFFDTTYDYTSPYIGNPQNSGPIQVCGNYYYVETSYEVYPSATVVPGNSYHMKLHFGSMTGWKCSNDWSNQGLPINNWVETNKIEVFYGGCQIYGQNPCDLPTNTPTQNLVATDTFTLTPGGSTYTFTPTYSITNTPTGTNTYTETFTFTSTYTQTYTFTYSNTPTDTATSVFSDTPTETFTTTETSTYTWTFTQTFTFTNTNTPTNTNTFSVTVTGSQPPTRTNTETFTNTHTETPTQTLTASFTFTPTETYTGTTSLQNTGTYTLTATYTKTTYYTLTFTPSGTATNTSTDTATQTRTLTPTSTYSLTFTFAATFTATNSYTSSSTYTVTFTPTFTLTFTITDTPTNTPTPLPASVELKLTLNTKGEEPKQGAKITYTIIIENPSNNTVSNLSLWDTLPEGIKFVSNDTGLPLQITTIDNRQYILWNLSGYEPAPGNRIIIEFTVEIEQIITMDGLITNTVAADYNDPLWIPAIGKHPPVISNMSFYPKGKPVVYPNPFNPYIAKDGLLKFENIVPGSTVYIYTIGGELVINKNSSDTIIYWDCKNKYGSKVSQGIYFYVIENKTTGKFDKGKLFIIK